MTPHNPHEHLDPELRPLADALDTLGAAERDDAPHNLEQSLLTNTLPHLKSKSPATTQPAEEIQPVLARIGVQRRNTLRLAAAIALIATATITGLLILTPNSPSTTPIPPIANQSTQLLLQSIDAELDDWLADLEALEDVYTDSDTITEEFWNIDENLDLSEETTS